MKELLNNSLLFNAFGHLTMLTLLQIIQKTTGYWKANFLLFPIANGHFDNKMGSNHILMEYTCTCTCTFAQYIDRASKWPRAVLSLNCSRRSFEPLPL